MVIKSEELRLASVLIGVLLFFCFFYSFGNFDKFKNYRNQG